jgi:hypothetical protein
VIRFPEKSHPDPSARIGLAVAAEPSDMRVVFPQGIGGGADIRLELAGVGRMQVPHGGGEDGDVTGTLKGSQNASSHRQLLKKETTERNLTATQTRIDTPT